MADCGIQLNESLSNVMVASARLTMANLVIAEFGPTGMPLVYVGNGFEELLLYEKKECSRLDLLFFTKPPAAAGSQHAEPVSALDGLQQQLLGSAGGGMHGGGGGGLGGMGAGLLQSQQRSSEAAVAEQQAKEVFDRINASIQNSTDVTAEFTAYR